MYSVEYTTRFKRSYKRCIKRGLDPKLLEEAVTLLKQTGTLPAKYKAHKLVSDYAGCWECHIQPNWLLVWQQNEMELTLLLVDTGTHADLF